MSGEHIYAQMTATAAQISATNSGGGPSTVTITAGTYYVDTLCAELETQLNTSRPNDWTVEFDDTTGRVTIDCADEPFSIAWTNTTFRDVLGFTADITAATTPQTGAKQAKGFWMPHCGLNLDGNPVTAPKMDDGRAAVSPTGEVYKISGVTSYRLRNLHFSHVPVAYVWAYAAALGNADYETFYLDTQAGVGHTWFSPGSRIQIFWDNAGALTALGSGSVTTWKLPAPTTLDELALSVPNYTGYVAVVLGDARSAG